MEDGGEGAAHAGPGVACSQRSARPDRGGQQRADLGPRCLRPSSKASGRDWLEPGPGEERATWPERSALLSVPTGLHSLRPVTPWRSLAVLGGEVF